jgi:hypothetical protein
MQRIKSSLKIASSKIVPDWLYKLSWRLRRIDNDLNLVYNMNYLIHRFWNHKLMNLNKTQQWIATSIAVILSGAPFTPYSHYLEHTLIEMFPNHPYIASLIIFGQYIFSVVLIKTVFTNILAQRRFHEKK